MVWVNPETLEVLKFDAPMMVSSFSEYEDIVWWCEENVGELGIDYSFSSAAMRFPHVWHFRSEDDVVMFKLRWL